MKTLIQTLMLQLGFCCFNASAQLPFTCKGDLYLSQSMGISESFSNLYTLSVDSISQEIIFNLLPATNEHAINAIGYRVTDNFIYGLDPLTLDFYKIDATGKSFLLRKLDELDPDDGYFAGDISPLGNFMVMLGGGDNDKNLVIINLEKPEYPTEVIPLKIASTNGAPDTRIFDIAFDPLTKKLYGFDALSSKLVTISLGSGTILDNVFPLADLDVNIAALFFDAFGNLYGYGSLESADSYAMYRIDKVSGQMTKITNGPSTFGVDGCSCPFNISIEKNVSPDTAYVCSEVLYVFRMANGSLTTQSDITLEDELPSSFKIVGIDYNPYTTTSIEGIGSNKLIMSGMTIPTGLDSIVLRVHTGTAQPGTYGNLAVLKNLPTALGLTRFSENPKSLQIGNRDSTFITLETPLTSFEAIDGICKGDTAIISLEAPNATFLWQDGSTDSFYIVIQPGDYSVTATTGCDTYMESITVEEQSIDLNFNPKNITVLLGNSAELQPSTNNTGDITQYYWTDPLLNSLDCDDCSNPIATPLEDVTYHLIVENEYGCAAEASIFVNVEINRDLYIPNIFSPNRDGINDQFFIRGAGNFDIVLFNVYDRWGNLVYKESNTEGNNPVAGWDGSYNGHAIDTGIFTWLLVVRYLDDVESTLTGTITLVR